MTSLVVFLLILAVALVRSLNKRVSRPTGSARRPLQRVQGLPSSRSWPGPAANIPASVPVASPVPAPPAPAGWEASAWAPVDGRTQPTWSAPESPTGIVDLREDPAIRPFLPAIDEPVSSEPAARVLVSPPTERYVGSAALESTLDSTIESSLLGVPAGPLTLAALPGASPLSLPDAVEAQVLAFVSDGHEVAAVRLVCDEMGCGILEAMRTVRSLD